MIHDSAENVIFTFGKYSGHTLAHIIRTDPQYLYWIKQNSNFDPTWKEAVTLSLEGKDIAHLALPKKIGNENVIQKKVTVEIMEVDDTTCKIFMPYDKSLVERFKLEIDGRSWNDKEKYWQFPLAQLPKVISMIKVYEIKVTPKLKEMYQKLLEETKIRHEVREKSDTDFEVKGIKLPLFPYQKIGVEFLHHTNGRALIADQPGLGKAQPLDSKILTPHGWKLMGDVSVGDEVITPNNSIAKIIAIHPQGEKDIYKITFNDGTFVESCLEHVWCVRSNWDSYTNKNWKYYSLDSLLKLGIQNNTGLKWEIPQVEPIKFTKKPLPLHPYLLGVLLGDGGLTNNVVKFTSKDLELVSYLEQNCLPENIIIRQSKQSNIEYTISRNDKLPFTNSIKQSLIDLNIMGKYSYEKEIPSVYLYSSLEDRIELFQGLMDTDGHYSVGKLKKDGSRKRGVLQFSSSSEKLIYNMKELVESFGGVARVSSKIPKFNNKQYRRHYILTISIPNHIVPFKLNRKLENIIPLTKYFPKRKIKKVEFSRKTEAQCITLDENGPLYITDNYTVTHNTVQAIAYAKMYNLKTLVIAPLSVVLNWKKEVKKFTGEEATIWNAKTVDGKLENNFHVINYDAVRKVHDVLTKMDFDLLVCDEATYLKNRNTLRFKTILGSYKERKQYPGIKTKHIIFLTGTPVLSRPIEAFTLLNVLDKQRFNNFYHFTQRYGGWKGVPVRNLKELHERTKDLVIRRKKSEVLSELPDKQRNDLYIELMPEERIEYTKLLDELFGEWKFSGKPTVGSMPKIQSYLIDKKIPRLKEMIDEYLDNDRPILIFCCFVEPLKRLLKEYPKEAVILHGSMDKKERQESIDKLTSGKAKIGLFSLKAAGMGIDGLQHVIDTVVFLDMDWVPANHEQAEDRTHRIGQQSKVQIYYMIVEDSIDEYMRDLLREKQQISSQIVDGEIFKAENSKSIFGEFIKKLSWQKLTN